MLACVVVIFATLWVPYRGLLVYNSFATMSDLPPFLDLWYLMFAKTCIYMNWQVPGGKMKEGGKSQRPSRKMREMEV